MTFKPSQIKDGDDVALGATTDTSTANTVIGRLKKLLTVVPAALGRTTMSASLPVTMASDQGAFPVKTDQTTHGTTDLVAADMTKIAGTAVAVNTGTVSAGTQRVVLATDQATLTNPLKVKTDQTTHGTTDLVAADLIKVAGAAIAVNTGNASIGTQRVVLATDQPAVPVTRGEGWDLFALTTADPTFPGTDVTAYSWATVQITANSSSDSCVFQSSLDNSTWLPCTLFAVGGSQSQGVSSTTSTGMWSGPVKGYFRVTNAGGNAVVGNVLLTQTPGVAPSLGVTASLTPSTSSSNASTPTRMDASATAGTATLIKSSSGVLHSITATNNTAAPKFLKLYNSGTIPTMGSGTPIMTIAIPANATIALSFGPYGKGFSAGIGATLTGASGDSDTTALVAHDVYVTLGWK